MGGRPSDRRPPNCLQQNKTIQYEDSRFELRQQQYKV